MRAFAVGVAVLACGACKSDAHEDYIRASKAIEARVSLERLAKSIKTYAVRDGTLPVGTAPATPSTPCCELPDKQCLPDPAAWQVEPWASLEFAIDFPHRFQYDITSDGKTFTAHAVADLSCDGKRTTLTMRGTLDPSTAAVTIELDDPTDKKRKR
jgi:hypothetical protein